MRCAFATIGLTCTGLAGLGFACATITRSGCCVRFRVGLNVRLNVCVVSLGVGFSVRSRVWCNVRLMMRCVRCYVWRHVRSNVRSNVCCVSGRRLCNHMSSVILAVVVHQRLV